MMFHAYPVYVLDRSQNVERAFTLVVACRDGVDGVQRFLDKNSHLWKFPEFEELEHYVLVRHPILSWHSRNRVVRWMFLNPQPKSDYIWIFMDGEIVED